MSLFVEFRARFPQLVGVPDPIVQTAIDDAMALWDPAVPNWGAVVCYQAAHSITVQTMAMSEAADAVRSGTSDRSGRRVADKTRFGTDNLADTQYGRELIRITQPYCGGGFGVV